MYEPIKIVYIITMLELGGAQDIVLYTMTHLDHTGFRPILSKKSSCFFRLWFYYGVRPNELIARSV